MFAPLRRLPPSLLLHTRRRRKQIPHLFLKIITVTRILTDSRRTLGLFQWPSTYHTTTAKFQGNYRVSFLLSCRACVRALKDTRVHHIPLSFVCTLCHHLLCCFFLLLFLTWTFANIFELQHSLCPMLFFSHKRNTLPLGNRFPSHTYTPKIGLRILEFLLHYDIFSPSLSPSFGQFFHHLFFFSSFFGSVPIPFSSWFFNYEKKKICPIYLLSSVSGGLQLTSQLISDMLSISFQVTSWLSAHSYIS